ncbi:hypothetical protein, partial [Bradyrhizobium elkanii]|uniref:hypothetical protein n=1 Tax=Bradyrhizobium elkanii TaxID=29448 RepID=UPI001AEBFFA7
PLLLFQQPSGHSLLLADERHTLTDFNSSFWLITEVVRKRCNGGSLENESTRVRLAAVSGY